MRDVIEDVQRVELKVEIARRVYHPEGNMFGIYAVRPINKLDEVKLNSYGNVSIQGETIPLQVGEEYDVAIEGPYKNKNPRYDDYYKILEVKAEELTSVVAQQRFLRAVLNEKHSETIIEAYPDHMIVDMILNDEVDVSKLKGIKNKTLDKIKKNLDMNRDAAGLLNELSKIQITGNAVKRIIEHFDSATTALYKVRESYYNLCEVSGFGFTKVDGYALDSGESTRSMKRIEACFKYVLQNESSNGHTWVDTDDLIRQACELTDLEDDLLRDYLVTFPNDNGIKYLKEKTTLTRLYQDELEVFNNLERINNAYKPVSSFDMFSSIADAEEELGIKYTDEQKEAIIQAMGSGVFILNGSGGTGKSLTIKGFVSICEKMGMRYQACALSGKASQILIKNGIKSSTIHRLLGAQGFNDFAYNYENKLPLEVVILDEASMVNAGLFKRLVQAIPDGGIFVIVGDSGQLSGIGHGDVLRDLLATTRYKKVELKQIHRQAQDSGIIELASKFRRGEQIVQYNGNKGQMIFGVNKDMVVLNYDHKLEVSNDLLHIIDSYKSKINTEDDLMDFQVLVSNKDRGDLSVKSINLYSQTVFNDMNKPFLKRGLYEFREGDKVIAQGNSYDISFYSSIDKYYKPKDIMEFTMKRLIAEMEGEEFLEELEEDRFTDLFNGTMGIVKKIDVDNKVAFIQFENIDGIIPLKQDELDIIDLAYCISIHKSQGSSIKNVVGAFDMSAFLLLSKQLAYTLITRASEKCVLLVENNALYKAISTDASGNRRTFLHEFINNQ